MGLGALFGYLFFALLLNKMQYPSPSSATTKPKNSDSLFGKIHELELFFFQPLNPLVLTRFFFFSEHQTTMDITDLFYVLRTKTF